MSMGSSGPSGILNYDKMEDKDKGYLVKLIATIITSIIAGIITGVTFVPNETNLWWVGWLLFFGIQGAMTYYLKFNFDMEEMTDVQIFRHGIFVGLLMYIFFWVVTFQFLIF